MISSREAPQLPSSFECPSALWPVTDADDVTGDVELILSLATSTSAQQAVAVASAIQFGAKPRSDILGNFAARLLNESTDQDTSVLMQAIIGTGTSALSNGARHALLSMLLNNVSTGREGENALKVLVTMTSRYLVMKPENQRSLDIDIRPEIVARYIPAILASGRAKAAYRAALTPELMKQVSNAAPEIGADRRYSAEDRARVQEFVGLSVSKR